MTSTRLKLRSSQPSNWLDATKISSTSIAARLRVVRRVLITTAMLVVGLGVVTPAMADEPVAVAEAPAEAVPAKPKEEARRVYLGRIVAKPMSHLGASWLVRPEREQEESVREAFEQLELREGMTVCDLGCGNGFWTIPISRKVGETGRVLAVDIQREMLTQLRERSAQEEVDNIELIRGDIDDAHLPAGEVDLVLLVDVYHEFSHPESMLWSMRQSLSPNGVVALLEYREEDPNVPIKPLHKMSKVQIMKEYEQNGFKLVREYNGLPWQHLMFFARSDSPLEAITPLPASEVLEQLQPK